MSYILHIISYVMSLLFELVYSSYSVLDKAEMIDMVKRSEISNERNGITGCLLNTQREFFQIIEGEKKQVLSLYDKIKKDKRHTNIKLMWSSPIDNRAFGEWKLLNQELSQHKLELTGKATTGRELFDILKEQVFISKV